MGLITSLKQSITKLFFSGEPKRIGIYGPPNAGKCLAASEPILLSDGTYRPIEDVFLDAREQCPTAPDVSDEPDETWIECTEAGIQVPALTRDLEAASATISHVFRQRYRGSMCHVTTKSGGNVTVSPDHPFIVVSEDGVEQKRADDVSTGTLIAHFPSVATHTADQPSSTVDRLLSAEASDSYLAADGGRIQTASAALPIGQRLESTREALEMTRSAFYGGTDETEFSARTDPTSDSPETISIDRIRSIANGLPRVEETTYIHALANGDAAWDEIESVESVDYDGYIYDLTVPEHHTFTTADGLVVHNTTLANRVARDWTGDAVGPESHVPHETRRARRKENVEIERNGSAVTIDIVDTPGVTTKVDYNEFLEHDMTKEDAVRRSREATEGVAEAMHWLREDVDGVIYVLDSTDDPFTQVNTMLVGIIESRDLPVMIFANKIDLEESSVQRIVNAFPQHEVVPLSALEGDNMQEVYDKIAEYFG